jgi:glycosyltransferase involved in cell wall biosynthesis
VADSVRVDCAKVMTESVCPNPTLDLSVILPALKADVEYLRCVYAIRAVLAGTIPYEIISVVRDVETFAGLASSDLSIIPEERRGIYAAMNTGLNNAKGNYVYFIGQDDILLPEVIGALTAGLQKRADVIVADVFWGTGRVYRNHPSPRSLIWRNWCHQGLIYRRELLGDAGLRFPEAFSTQADHYANIVLTAGDGATIVKHNGCIAWYSASGISCKTMDSAFRVRFPSLIREHFGFPSFAIVVMRRALLTIAQMVFRR